MAQSWKPPESILKMPSSPLENVLTASSILQLGRQSASPPPPPIRPGDDLEAASAGAVCQRRQQLGVVPLVALFRDVCRPLATPDTRHTFLFGLRLMAIEGFPVLSL
jgi:hypothetical protein